MRGRLFLVVVASAMAAGAFVGCGDGEEGGSASGGAGGTGGIAGDSGSDGDVVSTCPTAQFIKPASGATLTVADDSDNNCSNGIRVDVTVSTSASDGTSATLTAGAQTVGTATVSGGTLTFASVDLPSNGAVALGVRFDAQPACQTVVTINAACGGPTCEISKPILSPTHPELNGVPVAQGGDRVSADGQDYQAAFEVTTSIQDGQPVSLSVDGVADAAVALAQGGVAKFVGVTLKPDGAHEVQASCRAQDGQIGSSAKGSYPVDSTPPDLTNVTPVDGKFFGPSDDSDPNKAGVQFKVCGETSAADALDLPASLGGGEVNFCVAIGTSSPTCAPAKTGGAGSGNGGCVDLDCPGGAPFDLNVSLKDDAGNPTTKTISAVSCASSLPSVQIIEPVAGTGSDVTTHILAASMTQPRKDQDANLPGAQYTVVACTDTAGTATLLSGLAGGTLVAVAGQTGIATQAAQPSDNCPAGHPNVVKFVNATLTDSAEDSSGNLATATELKVEVIAASSAKGTSPAVQLWVDWQVPAISAATPTPLCGKLYQSAVDVIQSLVLLSTNSPVSLTVTSGGVPASYNQVSYTSGFASFGNVTFKVGTNSVVATTTKPSGNVGALQSPCVVTVGNPPVVSWVTPTQASLFNVATDGSSGIAGWQGTLTVQTDVGGSGGTVTFKLDCGGTVTTIGTSNIDSSGVATLANATLPDCALGTLTAETSNISGKGVGTASLSNKVIDTVVPNAPTGLAAAVKDRRATTFQLSWTAPSDGASAVGGYQVKVSKAAITAGNFDAAESVAFSGSPKAPGQTETLDVNSRMIETDYYFAVAATDAGGNRSSIVSVGPSKATFNQKVLAGGSNEQMGISIDGSSSVNGDAFTDLVVGGRNSANAYIWFGSLSGYATNPSVTLTGAVGTRFGQAVSVVGDIDGDTLVDIAIGAPFEGGKGRVYVFKGRANWPSSLTSGQADYVIDVDSVTDSKFATSFFGATIAKLGDFDQDGAADFAIGALLYGSGQGYVAVVRGVPSGQTFPASVTIPQDVGTRVVALPGDPGTPSGWFGVNLVGLGTYYSGGHPALVVAASNAGKVYAYQGDVGFSGTVAATSAKETYQGSVPLRTGATLSNLGSLFGSAALGVGSPSTAAAPGGDARLFYGTPTGIFAGSLATITNSAATSVGDNFGFALFGCGFSGSNVGGSFIGGPGTDVGFSSIKVAGAPAKLYLAEGSKLAASGDIVALADVVITLPADWIGSSYQSGPIKDSNNDGYVDLAIGEQSSGAGTYNGRVIVLY